MKIAVIGGGGFLGSHTADKLTEAAHEVTVIDREVSNWATPHQNMVVCDLLNYDELVQSLKGAEAVYNFAALSDLNEALSQPIKTINVNVLGHANLLEAAVQLGIRKVIYASSVYVNSREGGFYGCSKRAAEDYSREYSNRYDLDCRIIRYGSLFGPRAGTENGLYRIIKQAIVTDEVAYDGNKDSIRQYIYVEDAAAATVDILGTGFENSTIVLSGRESLRVMDLLEILREMLGIARPVKFKNKDYTGHYVRTPYALREPKAMKYSPKLAVELEQGLLETIKSVQRELHG